MKVMNATRHRQHDLKKEWFKYGVEFIPTCSSQIASIHPKSTSDQILQEAEDIVCKAIALNVEGILIGGMTGLGSMISILATKQDIRIIESIFIANPKEGKSSFHGYRDWTDILRRLIN